MPKIHISHPDSLFGEFLANYLRTQGFEITQSNSHVHSFTICAKERPHLIIMTKESPLLDAKGFIIKKEHTNSLAGTPVFLMGDFKPYEIEYYKNRKVEAFLSMRISPQALTERLYQFFNIPLVPAKKHTPMLMDIHAKSKMLIIQIEGNLEEEKTCELLYLMRRFFTTNNIRTPRVMIIIPNMYSDNINEASVKHLFSFLEFPNIKGDPQKIVLLSNVKALLDIVAKIPALENITIADNYYDAYRSLIVDFDVKTIVPVNSLKPESRFFLDLYGPEGKVIVKAMEEVGQNTLDYLEQLNIKSLTYYGDPTTQKIAADDYDPESSSLFDYISRDFVPVIADDYDQNLLAEKQNLFFSKIRGKHLLFVSLDPGLYKLIQQSLSVYFEIENVKAGENIKPLLVDQRFVVVFIDLAIPKEMVLKMLHTIRSVSSRRKTSIVLMARTVGKNDLIRYKESGTDHIILAPFTTEKLLNKVYTAMTLDRGS